MCDKNRSLANYSEKQKTDVRVQLSRPPYQIIKNPKCSQCTGGQIVELECTMCHHTKGLEAFAKSQSRKPDTAVRISV